MSLLSLVSVKPHLKIDQSIDNTVLQAKLDAAEAFCSRETDGAGTLEVTTVTGESHDGGTWLIQTLCRPIVAVTSIAESYGTYNRALTEQPLDGTNGFSAYGYTVDKDRGVIERRISGIAGPFAPGRHNVTVTYTTGYATAADLPDDLVDAVRLMTQHLYEPQRAGGAAPRGGQKPGLDAKARAMEILAGLNNTIVG